MSGQLFAFWDFIENDLYTHTLSNIVDDAV